MMKGVPQTPRRRKKSEINLHRNSEKNGHEMYRRMLHLAHLEEFHQNEEMKEVSYQQKCSLAITTSILCIFQSNR